MNINWGLENGKDNLSLVNKCYWSALSKDVYEVLNQTKDVLDVILSKPNMSAKDQCNMFEAIKTLKENNLLSQEIVERLNQNINYWIENWKEYISIWSIKWLKNDLSVKQNGTSIVNHNGTSFFYNEELLNQDHILNEMWMSLPTDLDVDNSIKSLIWDLNNENLCSLGWYIFATIINMEMNGRAWEKKWIHKHDKFWDFRVKSSLDPNKFLNFSIFHKRWNISKSNNEFWAAIRPKLV